MRADTSQQYKSTGKLVSCILSFSSSVVMHFFCAYSTVSNHPGASAICRLCSIVPCGPCLSMATG